MPTAEGDLRVLVVADDHLARAGLAALLDGRPGCAVEGQVSPAEYSAEAADLYREDVSVWDLGWDPENALGHMAAAGSNPPPLALVDGDTGTAAA